MNYSLPSHLEEELKEELEDAVELVKNAPKKTSWWKNLKNLLPGSHLQQIKEKNDSLIKISQMLVFHLTTAKTFSRLGRKV